jgi:hypothetical protein
MASTQMHREYGKGPTELWSPATELGRTTDPNIKDTMEKMFGDHVQIIPTMSHDLDARHELSHSTTGLKYAIRGRAKVVEQTVGSRLAAFEDPIKAIMPVEVVDAHRVIVTTKEVVGGRSIVAPERAPARTVGIKETTREVVLERYGADLEMNLNLQHEPALFKEEFDLKLAAQQRELERVLVELGYDEIMRVGLRLDTAIQRSMPAYNGTLGSLKHNQAQVAAERIYFRNCFGIMNKQRFPLHSILAAAKYATAYGIGQPGSVMILPHGMPEMLDYTRPEKMEFKISGLKTTDGKPITMDLGTSHTDAATNIKMLVHIPQPTFEFGSANPRVGPGCLDNVVDVLQYIVVPGGSLTAANCGLNMMADLDKAYVPSVEEAREAIAKELAAVPVTGATPADELKPLILGGLYASYAGKTFVDNTVVVTGSSINEPIKGAGTLSQALFATGTSALLSRNGITATARAGNVGILNGIVTEVKKRIRTDAEKSGVAARKVISAARQLFVDLGPFSASLNDGEYKLRVPISRVTNAVNGARAQALEFVDMSNGRVRNPYDTANDARTTAQLLIRRLRLTTQSAILAAPGADTGSLMVGMPHTAVSTSQTDESLKMQLRVYLGAVVKQPESVVIIPDVTITGVASSFVHNPSKALVDGPQHEYDLSAALNDWISDSSGSEFFNVPLTTNADGDACVSGDVFVDGVDGNTVKIQDLKQKESIMIGTHRIYRGSAKYGLDVITSTGHLSDIDDVNKPRAADDRYGSGGPGLYRDDRK